MILEERQTKFGTRIYVKSEKLRMSVSLIKKLHSCAVIIEELKLKHNWYVPSLSQFWWLTFSSFLCRHNLMHLPFIYKPNRLELLFSIDTPCHIPPSTNRDLLSNEVWSLSSPMWNFKPFNFKSHKNSKQFKKFHA